MGKYGSKFYTIYGKCYYIDALPEGGFHMEVLKNRYSITELSKELGITDHTLRYYEREFHIFIPKDNRGRRYYTTELANLMYQIKSMRNEGLEIKAIKKILQSENIISETPSPVYEDKTQALSTARSEVVYREAEIFFREFREQLTDTISEDINSMKDYISGEINRNKLEIGACIEHNMRRIETKLEKHFTEVDQAITSWRYKKKKGFFR